MPDKQLEAQISSSKKIKNNIKELTKNNQTYEENFSAQVTKKNENGVVFLYVEAQGLEAKEEKYRVKARCNIEDEPYQLNTQFVEPPKVSFSSSSPKSQILSQIRCFSQKREEAGQIQEWLLDLEEKLKKNIPYLVINDKTDFEIPWEMLELEPDRYLGASIVTIRWQDISPPFRHKKENKSISWNNKPGDSCGDVVAYTNTKDKDLKEYIESEIELLNEFKTKHFEQIHDFLIYLNQIKSPISLVYIASHGFWGDDTSKVTFGEKAPKNRFSLSKMYRYDFNFLKIKNSHTIFFMNACHSGRVQKDNKFNTTDQDERLGFATFFLEKGAKGVIGNLGEVLAEHASKIAIDFFSMQKNHQTLPVAVILCKLRAQAAENFRDNPTIENEERLISTFMYVYYGNPNIILQPSLCGE